MKEATIIKKVISKVSPVKLALLAFDHLTAKHFPTKHRVYVGFGFMVVGVSIAKFAHLICSAEPVGFMADTIGYLLHGAGCTPILEHFASLAVKVDSTELVAGNHDTEAIEVVQTE